MRIAYILFDNITLLDLIGAYDAIGRIKAQRPTLTWDLCAMSPTILDSHGMKIQMTAIQPDLSEYDVLFIPGGMGTRPLQFDLPFLNWLSTAESVPLKTSVCTGSLLLGAAGFLQGKVATTHFREYETLKPYCKEVATNRIVVDGGVITAGAVASSLDLGLYLCEKWVGKSNAEAFREDMDYRGADPDIRVV
ncbi:DJ-1/PfpI family protein [Pontibacter sp. G13]|uniref:DJ-1/PfpI family protein n=1 Tax=Pontibacter sp. G13 TaxID=3074898 RepID=UPI00288B7E8A|nr:DJ-1/PfpI family protein [Pontibacter sp. G13]WNJ17744.1 DJ-1/PfpI family protein [Pontibacter sp. G13]